MSTVVESKPAAEIMEDALRPLKVKYAVFVGILTATVVAVISVVSLVVSVAGIGEAASTGVVLAVIAWFATGSIRKWFGRYSSFQSWVAKRAFTLSFPGSAHLVTEFADKVAVARKFNNI